MRRWKLFRLLVLVCGALAATAVLVAVLVMVNAGWVFEGCTGTMALGWALPLLTGSVVGVVAWALLFKAPHYSAEDDSPHSVPCPSCGKAVMEDWRMCPYCGSAVTRDRATG